MAQTRLTIDYATIRAEADGRLGALPVDAGNLVRGSEGTVLATITQTDPIQVQFSVPERWLPEIMEAMARASPVSPPARRATSTSRPRASWSSWTARWTPPPAPFPSRRASPIRRTSSGPGNT
ncbi:HlyD family efflux transporter periplasmic adaptor subunit [Pseudoroseomonas wenyumeiae]